MIADCFPPHALVRLIEVSDTFYGRGQKLGKISPLGKKLVVNRTPGARKTLFPYFTFFLLLLLLPKKNSSRKPKINLRILPLPAFTTPNTSTTMLGRGVHFQYARKVFRKYPSGLASRNWPIEENEGGKTFLFR